MADKKIADSARVSKYYKTKEGLSALIYGNQKRHSKTRGHRSPEYTLDELREWLFSQTLYHELYDEWKQSGHKRDLSPSINRKCNDVHYCFRNIELMTWRENRELGHADRKSGADSVGKAIIQLTKQGELIATYPTIANAALVLGKKRATNINNCLAGKNCSAYGFIWKYKD